MTETQFGVLPDPVAVNALRLNDRPAPRIMPTADWYTPMLLFGQPGVVLTAPLDPLTQPPVDVGRIPIIYPCVPFAWYLSSNVPATVSLQLRYTGAPAGIPTGPPQSRDDLKFLVQDNPSWLMVTDNLPNLTGVTRAVYEEMPQLTGWPRVFGRYSEMLIQVVANDLAEQLLLVLYMRKLRLR